MTTTETVLLCALCASVVGNALLWRMYANATYTARLWGEALDHWQNRYHDLRRTSHRRDPKTGRLLPKGR